MMGMQIKKKIKVDEITIIEKKSMLGFIKNSIQITTARESFFFTSFSNRDNAFKLLYAIWKGEPYEGEKVEEEHEMPTS